MIQPKGMPIYVKIDEYKDVLDIMTLIKNKLAQAKDTLNQIEHLRQQEEDEVQGWRLNIEEVEKRIDDMDRVLFTPDVM